MATKNIDLNIKRPTVAGKKIVFTSSASADDYLRIPRRYPFADIVDYATLKSEGYFRHATTDVSSDLGGSSAEDTEGTLGFQLPNTEKLILLAKKGATTEETLTIKGSTHYGIDDEVVTLPAGSVGDLFEVDLYDFGLFIEGVADEDGVMIQSDHATVEVALIARMA